MELAQYPSFIQDACDKYPLFLTSMVSITNNKVNFIICKQAVNVYSCPFLSPLFWPQGVSDTHCQGDKDINIIKTQVLGYPECVGDTH